MPEKVATNVATSVNTKVSMIFPATYRSNLME